MTLPYFISKFLPGHTLDKNGMKTRLRKITSSFSRPCFLMLYTNQKKMLTDCCHVGLFKVCLM